MTSALSAYWLLFQNDHVLVDKKEDQLPLSLVEITSLQNFFLRQYELGHHDTIPIFCAELNTDFSLPEHLQPVSLKLALSTLNTHWYYWVVKAYSIINWDKNHQFCGRCGNKTIPQKKIFERICKHCSLTFYPRISPSIIVLIQKGEYLLMARSHHFPAGAHALIAGFVEVGENIEEAVHREVKEEVGVTIKNLQYFGSQFWPFPDSLMIAFLADYEAGELNIDKNEIEHANWYRFDQLPGRPSNKVSIASHLIDYFVNTHQKG